MKIDDNDTRLDRLIRAAIGRDRPPFDFEHWKQGHQRANRRVSRPNSSPVSRGTILIGRRATMTRTLKIAVAAVIFLGVCLGCRIWVIILTKARRWLKPSRRSRRPRRSPGNRPSTTTSRSKDGRRTWIESETREMAYKAPGLYREVLHPTPRGQNRAHLHYGCREFEDPESGPGGEKSRLARAGRDGRELRAGRSSGSRSR